MLWEVLEREALGTLGLWLLQHTNKQTYNGGEGGFLHLQRGADIKNIIHLKVLWPFPPAHQQT